MEQEENKLGKKELLTSCSTDPSNPFEPFLAHADPCFIENAMRRYPTKTYSETINNYTVYYLSFMGTATAFFKNKNGLLLSIAIHQNDSHRFKQAVKACINQYLIKYDLTNYDQFVYGNAENEIVLGHSLQLSTTHGFHHAIINDNKGRYLADLHSAGTREGFRIKLLFAIFDFDRSNKRRDNLKQSGLSVVKK